MTAVVEIENPSFTASLSTEVASVSTEVIPVPIPELDSNLSLEIIVADFDFRFCFPLVELNPGIDPSTMIVRASFDPHVSIELTLMGTLIEGDTRFQVRAVLIQMKTDTEFVHANFIASTLYALLAVATEVRFRIVERDIDLRLTFDVPLVEISRFLQVRQKAYRLMVIERAMGMKFLFPLHFSDDEAVSIAFVCRAIVDRSFVFPLETYPCSVLANENSLNEITAMKQPAHFSFIEERFSESILNQKILLGDKRVTIQDAIVENHDEVKNDLARLDNHEVVLVIRSLSGQVRFEFPEAPRLPDGPWDSDTQALVDLESQLDVRVAQGYHALAAATLAGLTEEEKARVTARPELDEGAFVTNDLGGKQD